jgi:hypothetical protein
MELLAKTNLLLEANEKVRGKTSHKTIKSAFNLRYKNSKAAFEVSRREVYNNLSDARGNARYLNGKMSFNKNELQKIYKTMSEMYHQLCLRAKYEDKS